mmetsp:Transcript_10153/g.46499  ORF Transcript_10153/g.46499 Transcript_10153/m.46499 type:complete len:201 (+) Transcript_10153:608-1210(+)
MNSRHETPIDRTRTQYMSEIRPKAPARSMRLFTSDAFHTPNDAAIKLPSWPSSWLSFADISARPVNLPAMRSNVRSHLLASWPVAFCRSSATPPSTTLCRLLPAWRRPPAGPSLSPTALCSPPRMDSPLNLTGSRSSSSFTSSKPKRETPPESTSPRCRVMMHKMATLLIMSVDVTGHTARTRMTLYSIMPSRSDRTCGM